MSENPLRLGIAGFGRMGQAHARTAAARDLFRVAGIFDPDEARRREASKAGFETFAELGPLLERCEALVVAAPTLHHRSLSLEALAAKKALLVEKPLARTLAEGEEILAAARGRLVQVGHIERFNPAVEYLVSHEAQPRFIQAERLTRGDGRSGDVSVVHDLMIHDIDVVLSLVRSRVASFQAIGLPVLSKLDDLVHVRLSFEDGCLANLSASRISLKPKREIRLFYPDRYASVDYQAQKVRVYEKKTVRGKDKISGGRVRIATREPLAAELESFAAYVRGQGACRVPVEAGLEALRLAEGVTRELERQRIPSPKGRGLG